MSWFKEIFKGSVNRRVSRGHYDGDWHEGHSSDHIRDTYDDSDNEDMDRAIALSLAEEDQNKGKAAAIDTDYNLEEDEQLARALQESLNAESPPRRNVPIEDVPVPPRWDVPVEHVPPRQYVPANEPPTLVYPQSGSRICAGCHNPIGHGRFLSCMGSVWHPQCFRCFACNKPISEYEFAMHDDQPYHKSCYKEFFHPKCDVCNNFISTNRDGLIEYKAHPFWMQKYCPSHEDDGTPRCCSCERMEVHTKKRNRLTTTRLNKLVFIQFNNKLINRKEKIKSKKISDVLLSSDTTKAQGFLHEDGDDCALVVYRDEEDEMEGTGIPWSVIGDAMGAEQQLELRRSARVRQLYEGEEFDSEEEEFDEDEDDYVEPY